MYFVFSPFRPRQHIVHCKALESVLFWCSECWVWLRAKSEAEWNTAVMQGATSSIGVPCPWALQLLPNSHQPPEANQGQQWAPRPAWLTLQYPNKCIFLSCMEPSSVFIHVLGVRICSYCFMSPPRWTRQHLQCTLHKPSLLLFILLLILISPSLATLLFASGPVCKNTISSCLLPQPVWHMVFWLLLSHINVHVHDPQRHITLILKTMIESLGLEKKPKII